MHNSIPGLRGIIMCMSVWETLKEKFTIKGTSLLTVVGLLL